MYLKYFLIVVKESRDREELRSWWKCWNRICSSYTVGKSSWVIFYISSAAIWNVNVKWKSFSKDLIHLKFWFFGYSTELGCIVAWEFWGCKPILKPSWSLKELCTFWGRSGSWEVRSLASPLYLYLSLSPKYFSSAFFKNVWLVTLSHAAWEILFSYLFQVASASKTAVRG